MALDLSCQLASRGNASAPSLTGPSVYLPTDLGVADPQPTDRVTRPGCHTVSSQNRPDIPATQAQNSLPVSSLTWYPATAAAPAAPACVHPSSIIINTRTHGPGATVSVVNGGRSMFVTAIDRDMCARHTTTHTTKFMYTCIHCTHTH